MSKYKVIYFLLVILIQGCFRPSASELKFESGSYENDLAYIHSELMRNHGGASEENGAEFRNFLNSNYKHYLEKKSKAKNYKQYKEYLSRYISSFKDVHSQIRFKNLDSDNTETQWPGIFLQWVDGTITVADTQAEYKDILGWALVNCDDKNADEWVKQEIFPFYFYKEENPTGWVKNTPRIFRHSTGGNQPKPRECVFQHKEKKKTYTLEWVKTESTHWYSLYDTYTFGIAPDFGMRITDHGTTWINVPSFQGQSEKGVKDFIDFSRNILFKRGKIKASNEIVIDLRGNKGGSTKQVVRLLAALYGEEFSIFLQKKMNFLSEWRLSQSNIAYVDDLSNKAKAIGENSNSVYFSTLAADMRTALSKGEETFAVGQIFDGASMPNPIELPVYVLTDGHCVSACLYFLEIMLTGTNAIHIGHETGPNNISVSNRFRVSPSGLANFNYPIEIRKPPRMMQRYFTPKYKFSGDNWTTENLEAWFEENKW